MPLDARRVAVAYGAGGWPYSLALVIGMLSVMALIVARF